MATGVAAPFRPKIARELVLMFSLRNHGRRNGYVSSRGRHSDPQTDKAPGCGLRRQVARLKPISTKQTSPLQEQSVVSPDSRNVRILIV